LVNSSEADA